MSKTEHHANWLEKAVENKISDCYHCQYFLIISRFSNDPHPNGLENGQYCLITESKPLKLEELKKRCKTLKRRSDKDNHHCLNCHVDRETTNMALPCVQCGGYYPGDCICIGCCCDSCKEYESQLYSEEDSL